MRIKHTINILIIFIAISLNGCYQPPYNNFKPEPSNIQRVITGAGVGSGMGAIIGTLAGNPAIGVAIGGTAGTLISLYRVNKKTLIQELYKQNIQLIEYGDTLTLIVPTDHYYLFNSSRLNDLCFTGLNNIIRLLKFYPSSRIYVAAFTDDVGSREHKRKLSQARAETMLAFLWAHNINARRLHAKGYSDHYTIGNDDFIRGSAYNRRIEIQWFKVPEPQENISISQKMNEK